MAQQMVTRRCMEQFSDAPHAVIAACKVDPGQSPNVECTGRHSYDELSPNADIAETPTKRNKRKLSEPRKRSTDFSIKRFCPDSPVSSVATGSETSGDTCLPTPETLDLRLTPAKVERRTPLKIPSVPFQPQCRRDNYFSKSPSGRCGEAVSPPLTEGDHSKLASHILNADRCDPLPTQRFGHYPSESYDDGDMFGDSAKHRKNYKNMTRARRVEANARERTRVHTISAAFEALRRAVPSYSYNQKLSKLAILRIASTYILSLARLADMDSGCPNTSPDTLSFSDCVDLCTQTIQTEGRARRRH